jgi:Kef-type K+ transport system membrane component KefB
MPQFVSWGDLIAPDRQARLPQKSKKQAVIMKNIRLGVISTGTTLAAVCLMLWVISRGGALEQSRAAVVPQSNAGALADFLDGVTRNLHHPVAILLMQIIAIILVARLFGWVFKKIGQPAVMGEIVAGIALGPSLLGLYFPEVSHFLLPVASLSNLHMVSQIGLIMFMFVIGMGIDLNVIKSKAVDAMVISHTSVILPFLLGVLLALSLYETYAPPGIAFLSFSLFIGIAMSITAFPVLARILQERAMEQTKLGNLVLTCAAADDITAWCALAAIIAIVKAGSFASALYVIAITAVYVMLMIKLVRPFLQTMALRYAQDKIMAAIVFLTLLLSCWVAEVIGVHALFGAFLAGTIMPNIAGIKRSFTDKVEDFSLILLLPLFFVFTGLRTQINLLDEVHLWWLTALIIVVAVTGKFLGSALAARLVGQNWKDSLTIGALMNTRGLMELVVLNIGYDLGVLSAELFTMMVIMALVTTFMTGPALGVINYCFRLGDPVQRRS